MEEALAEIEDLVWPLIGSAAVSTLATGPISVRVAIDFPLPPEAIPESLF